MDHSQFSRWGRMALPAAALWIAGCGAQSPAPDDAYAESRGLVRLEAPADLAPLSDAPLFTAESRPLRKLVSQPDDATTAPVAESSMPAPLDPGPSRTPMVALPETLPVQPPKFDFSALDEPGGANPARSPAIAPSTADEQAKQQAEVTPKSSAVAEAQAETLASPTTVRSVLVSAPQEEMDERGVLPWARGRSISPEMQIVSGRSMRLCRDGLRLAERGAIFSARAKFIEALRGIARALDVEQQTAMYTKALAAGMTALKESSDFTPRSGATQEIDVRHAIISHRTPVLKQVDGELPSATLAVQRYYNFAQEQLAAAAGQDSAGSFALYCLGRISLAAERSGLNAQEKVSQAIVFHQSALLVDPRNFLAANEAAVLLADAGRLAQARALLQQSVAVVPQAAVWHNLATVHARLGEHQLAAQAHNRASGLNAAQTSSSAPVTWVDPATFARIKSGSDGLQIPLTASKPAPPQAQIPQAPPAKPSASAWLPWTKSTRR